jgi:HK97 family phage portal protein
MSICKKGVINMVLIDFFKGLFQADEEKVGSYIDILLANKAKQLCVKEMAIEHAIDLIASTISKSEIKVFRLNKKINKIVETKDDVYYKLNIKANDNEVGTSFIYKVISKLLHEQEALVISNDSLLYLADSFDKSPSITTRKIFSNIKLSDFDGNQFTMDKKTFNSDEVIYLSLAGSKIKKVIDSFYNEYGKMLGIAASSYKAANTRKWRLKLPGTQPKMLDPVTSKEISYEDYKKKITEGLFSEEEAIVMLADSFGLEQLGDNQSKTSEDYRNLILKWEDEIAKAFKIPLDIFHGNKTDKSVGINDYISLAVLPILEILEDGLNASLIKKDAYLLGDHIKVNRYKMKHYDIFDIADPIDKLLGDGFSHNEICGFLDLPLKDEAWANEHFITKNFGKADDMMKGGDE